MAKDFRKKDFSRSLRGYSPEEVDKYLEAVTAEYRRLEKRAWETSKQLADVQAKLDEMTITEQDAAETLDAADAILADANSRAGAMLNEAQDTASAEADSILKQANEEAGRAREDAEALRKKAEELLKEADGSREAAAQQKSDAFAEARRVLGEAEAILKDARGEAEAIRSEAADTAEQMLAEAETARSEADALRTQAAEDARIAGDRREKLEKAMRSFFADVKAYRSAAESMANAQVNAALNFAKDAEAFLAQMGEGGGSAPDADELMKQIGQSGADDIAHAVAAMRDIIVDIPDEPDDFGEPDDEETLGESESEEPDDFEEDGGEDDFGESEEPDDFEEDGGEDDFGESEEPDDFEEDGGEDDSREPDDIDKAGGAAGGETSPGSDGSDGGRNMADPGEGTREAETREEEDDSGDFLTGPASEEADALAYSLRSLLNEYRSRPETTHEELDELDFEKPTEGAAPFTDIDFEALTASLRREGDDGRKEKEDDEEEGD